MKIKMPYLLLVFATVLTPTARGQSTPPQPKTTGVLTIYSPKPGVTPEQVMKTMPAEIRATVPLYLDGKIQQWFMRADGRGVIFLLNCQDVAEARAPSKPCLSRRKTSWTSSSFRWDRSCRSGYFCEIIRSISELGKPSN